MRKLPLLPPPTMSEVLFEPPFDNGDGKGCVNCALFVRSQPTTCALHGTMPVPWDWLCGHHVPGTPMPPSVARELRLAPLSPATSGLRHVPGGSSCDRCVNYVPRAEHQGVCELIERRPVVPARASCIRWRRRTTVA